MPDIIIRTATSEQEVLEAVNLYWVNEDPEYRAVVAEAGGQWLAIYTSSPEGFWIAEDRHSGQIIGVAAVARRPPQWLLTNFFVHPAYHGQGIGKALLSKAMTVREGCERFCVHASQHSAAQSLYMQFGMYPLPYSILFQSISQTLPGLPAALAIEACVPDDVFPILNELDLNALGYTREVDHRWWAKHGSYFLVRSAGIVTGYFRVSPRGLIGPLVVSDSRWMRDTLDLAIGRQMEMVSTDHKIFVPGANTEAIGHLLALGYRYIGLELLLSSHPMPGLAKVVFFDTDLL